MKIWRKEEKRKKQKHGRFKGKRREKSKNMEGLKEREGKKDEWERKNKKEKEEAFFGGKGTSTLWVI